jgi:hypothetical protein
MIRAAPQLVLLVAVVAVTAASAVGRDLPELIIEAPPRLASVADEVAAIGDRGGFGGALAITGVSGFTTPIRVVLVAEDHELARQTPAWVSGFADGARRTIVLFPNRVARYPDNDLRTLVHHEVTHVLVAEAARGRPVPRWFNEGIATVAAREWGIEDRARYAAAVVGRGPRTTAELDLGFAAGGRRVTRSYALSGAFVRWLRVEYGRAVTARILGHLAEDRSFREAFVRSTGNTIEWAEHRFFVREALWHTWVPFLTSSGVLWAAITGLAIVAIRRRRQRSAAMRERWEAQEELLDLRSQRPGRLGPPRRTDLDDVGDGDPVN